MKVLVTGGAGFIGSALVRQLIADGVQVINVDSLTYAANLENLAAVSSNPGYVLERADICDGAAMSAAFNRHQPDAVMHLAAESHVDRSIDAPNAFVQTNVVGTTTLLNAARSYWSRLGPERRSAFRFLHVSTDEVYGTLGPNGSFTEDMPYRPNSPYSASKAGSDLLARAWFETYGLPVIVTNSTNNYGPYQFPEKLIPLMIVKGLAGEAMPVYGTGSNVRDWVHVDDHAEALRLTLERGVPGRAYNIGGECEKSNLEVVHEVCRLLDVLAPLPNGRAHADLITFVADRPGHDQRYAMDISRIRRELGWSPGRDFKKGIAETVAWYLDNRSWWTRVLDGTYRGERLGLRDSHESAR